MSDSFEIIDSRVQRVASKTLVFGDESDSHETAPPSINVLNNSNGTDVSDNRATTAIKPKPRAPRKKRVRQTAQEKVAKAKETEKLPPFLDKLQYEDICSLCNCETSGSLNESTTIWQLCIWY
mmetsp:Transcript_27721/g.76283  ORF Transcript_27721/g.76283 Transcript_27721/m.76283 type:complete len:123 (+) Transcript_27721:551-919(+)